jgi:hypothetical protein
MGIQMESALALDVRCPGWRMRQCGYRRLML